MEENILKVKNDAGIEIEIEVIDILENEQTGENYVAYKLKGGEDMFISLLVEDENSYSLETVTDEEKLKGIEEYFLNEAKLNNRG